jgi:hypothetical protein
MNVVMGILAVIIILLSVKAFANWTKFWRGLDKPQSIVFVVHFLLAAVLIWGALGAYSIDMMFEDKTTGVVAHIIFGVIILASIAYVHLYKSPNAGELKPFNQSEKYDR